VEEETGGFALHTLVPQNGAPPWSERASTPRISAVAAAAVAVMVQIQNTLCETGVVPAAGIGDVFWGCCADAGSRVAVAVAPSAKAKVFPGPLTVKAPLEA